MMSLEQAQLLLREGRIAEAERAFAAILAQEPDHVQALNVMALVALRSADLGSALALIERARRADALNPLTLHNQGRILDAAERYDEAAAAQRAALQAAPNFHAARLYLGRVLERSGEPHRAIVAYARALQDAQAEGRWLNEASTPAGFRPLVEHAVLQVKQGRRAAIAELLEPLIRTYGRDSMHRVDRSLRVYFNEEAAALPQSGQRPSFFHFPDIPASPYLAREQFPWIDSFEAQTIDIRRELSSLLPGSDGRERVFGSAALEANHLRGLKQPPTWNGYYFYRHGERRNDNCDRCSRTAAALDSLPLCRIREHGPEVLFSVFTPGTHLLPHRGVTNIRVVAHLPLVVPENCQLVVGGEPHCWQEGRVVVFDDTYEHEAWNRSGKTRVVLIFDLWSPYLSEAERAALAIVIEEIGDFRRDVEALA
jgi:aspartate beta-hydroxylase